MKYKVKIEEVLAKYVEVEAESPRKAKNLVRQMYFDEEIQLGSDYLIETSFVIEKDILWKKHYLSPILY